MIGCVSPTLSCCLLSCVLLIAVVSSERVPRYFISMKYRFLSRRAFSTRLNPVAFCMMTFSHRVFPILLMLFLKMLLVSFVSLIHFYQ